MLNTADLYLGSFLILSGFALSLLNLRRIIKKSDASFSSVLLSENILLMCIGIAFVSRSVSEFNPMTIENSEMEERTSEIIRMTKHESAECNIWSTLMSYGPLTVSLVNSFLSLIIDNYMHYRMVQQIKEKDDENVVQEISQETRVERKLKVKSFIMFWKRYFTFIAIASQWVIPTLMVVSMYPMGVKEKLVPMSDLRSIGDSCTTLMDVSNVTCSNNNTELPLELRKYISPINYLEVYENEQDGNNSEKINSIISSVYKIVTNLNKSVESINVTSPYLHRKSKSNQKCMKMCFVENKKLLLHMLVLSIVSYFVPITISTIILTKIHVMDVKKPNIKTYVSRELLYNILFWTPVMFDTFLSLIFCSYTMNGMRTSLFNVIANIYQTVKNFMNTRYFNDNTVSPV